MWKQVNRRKFTIQNAAVWECDVRCSMLFLYLSVTKTAKKAFFARKTIARQKHQADTCKQKLDTVVSDRNRYEETAKRC